MLKRRSDGLESAPHLILAFLAAYLVVYLVVLYLWNVAGQAFAVRSTPDGAPALSVTLMAGVSLWLCRLVLRSFPHGAPLRRVWALVSVAAGVQVFSGVAAQLLSSNWLNPLGWSHSRPALLEPIRRGAVVCAVPVQLMLLAAAMLVALRVLRKYGFGTRPSTTDWAVSAIVYLFALSRFIETGVASLQGWQIGFADWASLASLPLLCALVFEAMLLRQAVLRMGTGLIAKCWAAFMCGIFLTAAGQLVLWVIPHYSSTWPAETIETLLGFSTAAVLALAPACQVAAQRRALRPDADPSEDLKTGVPALAR